MGVYNTNKIVRFCVMPDCRALTLLSFVEKYVESERFFVTDVWAEYQRFQSYIYVQKTVNNSEN